MTSRGLNPRPPSQTSSIPIYISSSASFPLAHSRTEQSRLYSADCRRVCANVKWKQQQRRKKRKQTHVKRKNVTFASTKRENETWLNKSQGCFTLQGASIVENINPGFWLEGNLNQVVFCRVFVLIQISSCFTLDMCDELWVFINTRSLGLFPWRCYGEIV